MMNKIYTITLSDGTVLENLGLNGNNFISAVEVTEETFKGKLGTVTFADNEGNSEVHSNMELVQVAKYKNEYWFILRDISESELLMIKQRADLEYVAMMTGVEL